jgi:hypothetical protein
MTVAQNTVAQNNPAQPQLQRIPMMQADMLDERTRPADTAPMPIWLGHRLRRRRLSGLAAASGRAREWLRMMRRGSAGTSRRA